MLTPEYLEGLPDPVIELYQQAEDAILEDMARRIVNTDLWTPSADWQYRKLREAGALSEDILRELARLTGKSQAELRKLMQAAAIESMGYDEGIYESHGMTGEPLASSDALTDILNAGYRATAQTMLNLTRTTANTASQQFERALDAAWMKVQSGAFSTDAAVRSAVKELAGQGVEAIKYPSGHRDTIEVAVRRAVVTGVNQTCGQLQLERAREMGADLMELTAHEGARPSHAEWQGKIVSLSGQPGYLSLKNIGYGEVTGFKGANCRHDWNPWFEGMPRTWTPEALAKLNQPKYEWDGKKLTQYEASQIQRYNERQIRKWKRIYKAQKAAGQDTSEAAAKISQWNKRQGDFLRATGFKRRQSREELANFGLKETRAASEEAKAHHDEWLKSINAESTELKTLDKYYEAKYSNSPEYQLLMGYNTAVEKGDISPLIGFDLYKQTSEEITAKIVGQIASNGVRVEGFVPHFIDRVIGQTSTPHPGMRLGVPVDSALDTILNGELGKVQVNGRGERSQLLIGADSVVAMNPDTGMLIQTNPKGR